MKQNSVILVKVTKIVAGCLTSAWHAPNRSSMACMQAIMMIIASTHSFYGYWCFTYLAQNFLSCESDPRGGRNQSSIFLADPEGCIPTVP